MTQPVYASVWAALGAAERATYLLMYAVEPRDHYERTIVNEMELAAKELGYRLVPLTQDKNDSGRLSEVPDTETEPSVGEVF